MIVNARLYLALFFVLIALGIAGIVFAIEVNSRGKRDVLAVRGPFEQIRTGGKCCELLRFAAIHGQQVDLRISVARGKKGERFSVWGPRRRVVVAALRELYGIASACRDQPDV